MLPRGDGKAKKAGRNDYREAFLKGTGQKQSTDEVLARTGELEAALEALKVSYEHFFLGLTRHTPRREHDVLRSSIVQLRGAFVRNTTARFRLNSLYNRLLAYERMWERTIREIEDGTYRRDLFKARMRRKGSAPEAQEAAQNLEQLTRRLENSAPPPADAMDFDVTEAAPVSDAPPARPVPAPRPAPPRSAANTASSLSDDRVRAIYDAYVSAKRRCKESTQGITYEALASTLRKQMPALMQKHNSSGIDFKVVIKGGKAVLKAVPRP